MQLSPPTALPPAFDRDLRAAHALTQRSGDLLRQTGSTGHGALYDPTIAPPSARYAEVLTNARAAQALISRYAEEPQLGERGRSYLHSAIDQLGRISTFLGTGPSTDEISVKSYALISQAESAVEMLHRARVVTDDPHRCA